MKNILGFLKRHIIFFALLGVAAIMGLGIYGVLRMQKKIKAVETEIKTKYTEVKKYEQEKDKAPSEQLVRRMTQEKEAWSKTFNILLTKFSTAHPTPPEYKLFPAIEFKEFLFYNQDYLAKKAKKKNVLIPSSLGFPETGLAAADQIPLMSLQLEVVKRFIELSIDSGVSVINSVTPGLPSNVAFYKVLPLKVSLMGSSVEIVRFLKYLENPSSFFVLESFSLSQTENRLFKADMSINAIMMEPAAAEASPAAAAPAVQQPATAPAAPAAPAGTKASRRKKG